MKKVFFSFYLLVIAMLLFLHFVYSPILDKIFKFHPPKGLIEYNRKLARGAFFLMEQDLLRLPEEKWNQHIATLKPHFGYGIGLIPFPDAYARSMPFAILDIESGA